MGVDECKCSPRPGAVFRPALSSPASDPVLVRVCIECDLPILGMGHVVTTKGWQVFQRKASMVLRRTVRRNRSIRSTVMFARRSKEDSSGA